MLSKIKCWEFTISEKFFKTPGLKGFVTDDTFIESIIKERIPKKELELRLFIGNEVSKDFLEDQFLNLTLFSSPQNILILNAELMDSDVLNFLFTSIAPQLDAQIILFFNKVSKTAADLIKNAQGDFFEIEKIKPWEGPKLLGFFLKELGLNVRPDVQKFLLENLEHESEAFYQAIKLIQLSFPDGNIAVQDLKNLIARDRYDFFELIDLYHIDRKKFLIAISRKTQDYEWFRQFASSMQGHIVKILFPEEIIKKDKPSKYDQNILRLTETENRLKLKDDLEMFSSMELMAKSKDEFLKDKVRNEILK